MNLTVRIQAAADFICQPCEDEDELHAAIFVDDLGCELRLDAGADFQSRLLTWLKHRSEPGEQIEIECEFGSWVFISRACFFPALVGELDGREVRYAFPVEPMPAPSSAMSM